MNNDDNFLKLERSTHYRWQVLVVLAAGAAFGFFAGRVSASQSYDYEIDSPDVIDMMMVTNDLR